MLRMKISEMITDRYKLRIPPTVYYDLLADVQEAEEEQEPTTKNDLGVEKIIDEIEKEFEKVDIPIMDKLTIFAKVQNALYKCAVSNSEIPNNSTTKNNLGVDCISRTSALDSINWAYNLSDAYQKINDLPSVTPQPCEDTVSRKDVHDMLENLPVTVENKWFNWLQMACMRLAELPSVTPQPRKGHWIKSRDSYGTNHYTCPFCEHDIATKYAGTWKDNYCSNCGADMRGEEV